MPLYNVELHAICDDTKATVTTVVPAYNMDDVLNEVKGFKPSEGMTILDSKIAISRITITLIEGS